MEKPLYIVWSDQFEQGNAIIDEQHRGVLATINSLNYFLQQGASLKDLFPTIKMLVSYLMFHYKTEEGILKASEYPKMHEYKEKVNLRIADFQKACEQAIKQDEPEIVLQFLGEWWQRHLTYHGEFSPFLSKWTGEYCRIDETQEKDSN
jgi:hemerythrin